MAAVLSRLWRSSIEIDTEFLLPVVLWHTESGVVRRLEAMVRLDGGVEPLSALEEMYSKSFAWLILPFQAC